MNTPYALIIEVAQPLDAAHESLRRALALEQMLLISEVDLQALIPRGPGAVGPAQRLVGLGGPRGIQALLAAEPDIAALLPFGASLAESRPGHTRIVLQDPRMVAAATQNAEVRAACELARAALRRVADRLALAR
jgi:uncharacterized protein (DUF302 family)